MLSVSVRRWVRDTERETQRERERLLNISLITRKNQSVFIYLIIRLFIYLIINFILFFYFLFFLFFAL